MRYLVIICLCFNLNAQTSGYSFYGVGEDISGYNAESAGLGGAQFISGNYFFRFRKRLGFSCFSKDLK